MDIIKSSYPLSNCTKGILTIDNCALKLVLTVLFPAILLTCLSVHGVAQTSDTLQAVDIRVKTADNNGLLDIGNKKIEIDSIYRQAYSTLSLDRLLQDQSNIFVRSYGVNNMATFSIRGTSAAQNILLWQGIPINSPSMGMADISLINNVLFHNIAIEYGSNSLQYGSGNMGGNIQLSNGAPKFEKQINNTLIGSLGSYHHTNIGNRFKWSNQRWHISLNAFYQQSNNDFYYYKQNEKLALSNAHMRSAAGLLSLFYRLPTNSKIIKHYINGQYWIQNYQRAIPPALFENKSAKFQEDESSKGLLQWHLKTARLEWNLQVALIHDNADYNDSMINLFTHYQPKTFFAQANLKYHIPFKAHLGNHFVQLLTPLQLNSIHIKHNDTKGRQDRQALALIYQWQSSNQSLTMTSGLRKEWSSMYTSIPVTPSLSANIKLLSTQYGLSINTHGAIQRSYRMPTLHELYFFPGGNIALRPEQGWDQQAGIKAKLDHKRLITEINLAIYNRKIKDWIYWMGGAIWTPHNIAKVHSRGIDFQYSISYQLNKNWKIQTQLSYAYTLSTTIEHATPNDKSINKQIPYVPKNLLNNNITISWKGVMLNYNHGYTGYRFTTTDESHYLNSYYLANTQFTYPLLVHNYQFTVGLNINNIFNTNYVTIANRPMPGRNFLIHLKLHI